MRMRKRNYYVQLKDKVIGLLHFESKEQVKNFVKHHFGEDRDIWRCDNVELGRYMGIDFYNREAIYSGAAK